MKHLHHCCMLCLNLCSCFATSMKLSFLLFFQLKLSAWRKNTFSDSDLPWYLTRTAPAWGLMLWKRMEIWLLWLLTTKPLIRMDSLASTVFSLFRTSSKITLSPSERFTFITWQKQEYRLYCLHMKIILEKSTFCVILWTFLENVGCRENFLSFRYHHHLWCFLFVCLVFFKMKCYVLYKMQWDANFPRSSTFVTEKVAEYFSMSL